MKRLRIKSPADGDYLQAVTYYEEQQPGLGREFELELQTLFERIKRNPEFFAKETVSVRRARMPRFKYGIYFTIEGDEIGVVAIYHPSRDPERLRQRLK
jgi:plasmid stabilization system protein ParE